MRDSYPPRPFVPSHSLDSWAEYRPGDRLTFLLTTFGRVLSQSPHTLIAVNEVGHNRRSAAAIFSTTWRLIPGKTLDRRTSI